VSLHVDLLSGLEHHQPKKLGPLGFCGFSTSSMSPSSNA
jgi:hypothetical protein